MPFETGSHGPKRIAVIGGGISGMSAAHMLSGENAVVLFESERRLGGHARTVFAGKNPQPVDTGFLVFNYHNYPYLTALFHELAVPVAKSDMSFGCSINGGWFEYGILARSAIFAQKRNLLRPKFWVMLRDMLKFGNEARSVATDPDMTIGELIDTMGLSDWFRDYYLLPMSGAIWSTPTTKITDFPAKALVDFFHNHRLLSDGTQHQWYTVDGGSIEYVRRLETRMKQAGVDVRLGAAIQGVRRTPIGVEVRALSGEWEHFDEVVFATHSDDSLAMLADPSEQEHAALNAVKYQPNEGVMHSDASVMPKRKAVWAAWNYTEAANKQSDVIDLTYWINRLQNIEGPTQYFVTLNAQQPIRDELVHDTYTFRHPVFDGAALAAQEQVRAFNGTNRTWFCGAWMKNGFHEDGISSAVDVVHAMQMANAVKVAAE
ncbi:NAD(P)/FAD-dependent oxidoreductase [Shimia ponticola]|uniref:NAD(P)/FAD-dependent oxidoreductase n=1 Tax=Shimia ponticola TaxID=2582893 RepID=UPI0011BEA6E7|nr:FAD-dependent oxidoreductase [Shimia ponticola]